MGSALAIRDDVPAAELRRLARLEDDGRVACRLLALANALEGMSRAGAAEQAGMDRQTLRDWVLRFNQAGVEGLCDRPRRGRPSFLTEGQLATFKAWVLRGPDPERDGRSSWTARTCAAWWRIASPSATARTGCSACCTSSACPGRRPGRCTRRPT